MKDIRKYGFSWWTLYELFKKCPYSYHLARERGIQGGLPEKLKTRTFVGALFHTIMEKRTKHDLTWEKARMLNEIGGRKILKKEFGEAYTERRASKAVKIVNDDIVKVGQNSEIVAVLNRINFAEKTFERVVNGIKLKGRIDAGNLDYRPTFILDFKLFKKPSGGTRQVTFYTIVVGGVDKAFVLYPEMPFLREIAIRPEYVESVKMDSIELAEDLLSGNRKPNLKSCSFCYYKRACEHGRVESERKRRAIIAKIRESKQATSKTGE